MKRTWLIFLVLIFSVSATKARQPDTISGKKLLLKSIVPVSLIVAGSAVSGSTFEKDLQTSIRNSVGNNYSFPIDDYIQFAPVVEMYVADMAGVKSKNHWFDQTKYLIISNLFSLGITTGLKYAVDKTRPNEGEHSFPSGHTTLAFTNATVLYNEFYNTSPALAYSGYAFALTTGAFRMINNKHWLSDVLAGAGIGILVTNLVYYFEPLKNFNPFKKQKNIVIIPNLNYNNYQIYFSCRF
jgi:hypothetical protein